MKNRRQSARRSENADMKRTAVTSRNRLEDTRNGIF
nr:MAG TPA: hypothetical protein [Caudoviricetes sp.]DAX57834.1 MAG TPA: hypothetical protein [Caudoviricetes sp.]